MNKLLLYILIASSICILLIFLIIFIILSKNKNSSNITNRLNTPDIEDIKDNGKIPMISNYCESGCDQKNKNPQFYMCPQLMLGSDELIEAAKKDGNDWAYYGVATHFNDKGGCGRCYQISYLPYCGSYWADKENGLLCCLDGDKCNYSTPYDCYQSQLSHCCLNGDCNNCQEWSGPNSDKLKDENPDQNACISNGGTFCNGWCQTCNIGGNCKKCRYFPKKPLILQSFNTVIGCTPPKDDSAGQFDIYMGAGGLGNNNGCSNSSKDGTTYGGGFYGGVFDDWPDIKEGHKNGGVSRIDMCDKINEIKGFRNKNEDWNGNTNWGKELIKSCKLVMDKDNNPYHGNWAIRFKEVECPINLSKVTGMRLKYPNKSYNNKDLPKPSKDLVRSTGREGSIKDGFPGFTSSMMDCCKPSCSWDNMIAEIKKTNNDIDPLFPSIFMCDKNGSKIYQDEKGLSQLYQITDDGKNPCFHSDNLTICQNKKKDYDPSGCKKNEECCSNICSIGKNGNSQCCPLTKKSDGNGNCK